MIAMEEAKKNGDTSDITNWEIKHGKMHEEKMKNFTNEAWKAYHKAIEKNIIRHNARYIAMVKAKQLGDNGDITQWEIEYGLERQENEDPEFKYTTNEKYTQGHTNKVKWTTGWHDSKKILENYKQNKDHFYINPINGEITLKEQNE